MTRTLRHRRTDPRCTHFTGAGGVVHILGHRIRTPRRVRYDHNRGRSCPICMPPARSARLLAEHYFGGIRTH